MADHHIQRQILERLAFAPTRSFTELKPDDLANNAFSYHLKQLLAEKLVQKQGEAYGLTVEGQRYVDKYSLATHRPRQQPKVICQIVLRNRNGEYLLARHKRQPFLEKWAFWSGKQHFGESSGMHAQRELIEQLGKSCELTQKGFIDFRISNEELVSHVVGPVYAGNFDGEAPAATAKFAYAWHGSLDGLELVPGTAEILQALTSGSDNFFLSLDLCDN